MGMHACACMCELRGGASFAGVLELVLDLLRCCDSDEGKCAADDDGDEDDDGVEELKPAFPMFRACVCVSASSLLSLSCTQGRKAEAISCDSCLARTRTPCAHG